MSRRERSHPDIWERYITEFDDTFHQWINGAAEYDQMHWAISNLIEYIAETDLPEAKSLPSILGLTSNLDEDRRFCWNRMIAVSGCFISMELKIFPKLGEDESAYRLALYKNEMKSKRWIDPDYEPESKQPSIMELIPEWFTDEGDNKRNAPDQSDDNPESLSDEHGDFPSP